MIGDSVSVITHSFVSILFPVSSISVLDRPSSVAIGHHRLEQLKDDQTRQLKLLDARLCNLRNRGSIFLIGSYQRLKINTYYLPTKHPAGLE